MQHTSSPALTLRSYAHVTRLDAFSTSSRPTPAESGAPMAAATACEPHVTTNAPARVDGHVSVVRLIVSLGRRGVYLGLRM